MRFALASTSCSPPPLPYTIPSISALPFGGSHSNRLAKKWQRKITNRAARREYNRNTAIVDSGASGIYLMPDAPTAATDPSSPPIRVGTATGCPQRSSASCRLNLQGVDGPFPTAGHVMPGFAHNLVGIGPFCDKDCSVLHTKNSVTIFDPQGTPILAGWREKDGARLWRISLSTDDSPPPCPLPFEVPTKSSLSAFSAYDLPSVEALVCYLHAAAGFPVKDTWLEAIKAGFYDSWPGLTFQNASRYCPRPDETIKGHMVQSRQGVRSTKPKAPPPPILQPTRPLRTRRRRTARSTNSTFASIPSANCTLTIVVASPSARAVAINTSWWLTIMTPT